MNDLVVITGLANAGKSTLFNALSGKKRAIVSAVAGTTRDWHQAPAAIGDMRFTVVDTFGVSERTAAASRLDELLQSAQAVIFLIDGQVPLSPQVAAMLNRWRKLADKRLIAVVNKCEGQWDSQTLDEAWRLGLGEPVAISAIHKEGFADLAQALAKFLDGRTTAAGKRWGLRMVLLGSPNVGKSTLANRLLGETRLATDEAAGTTTDAVLVPFVGGGRKFELVDTAGIKRRIIGGLDRATAEQSQRALRLAEVAVVVFEPMRSPSGDMRIIQLARKEGRALVAALNKCDTLSAPKHQLRQLQRRLEKARFFDLVPLACSAKTGVGCGEILKAVEEARDLWRKRIPTAVLNRWLAAATAAHPPPAAGGRRPVIKFVTQIKSAPPTFLLAASRGEKLPRSYINYLESHMRRAFAFKATPLRFRLQRNPRSR